MSKQDDQFLPEQVDEQIETLAHLEKNSALPEARLASDLHQIYDEEREIAERVRVRLNRHLTQSGRERTGQKYPKDQALHRFVKEVQPMKTKVTQQPPAKNRWHVLETLAAVLVIVALVASMTLLFQWRRTPQPSQGSGGKAPSTAQILNRTTVTTTPIPPTSVKLRVSALGIPPTTRSKITVPSGTKVTLSVIPDHSLLPFQILTMGIYATDPYGFSELQYCTYPKTDTCSYTIAYSSSEKTDYTKGKHTFRAFLGNIGGLTLEDSSSITITWS